MYANIKIVVKVVTEIQHYYNYLKWPGFRVTIECDYVYAETREKHLEAVRYKKWK